MFNFNVKRSGKTSKINRHLSSVLKGKKEFSRVGGAELEEQKEGFLGWKV